MRFKIYLTTISIAIAVLSLTLMVSWTNKPSNISSDDLGKAVSKSLPLLQKSGYVFINKSRQKCASCHHNTLTAMANALARKKGIPVIDSLSAHTIHAM
ncbi:MAG TPA: hypothetical protein VFV08_10995, partial [Puia sp.]|nr:hypothetical protein [Puia sp.]